MAMMCQSCQTRAATVHFTDMVNEKVKHEIHLCEDCFAAQKTGGSEVIGSVFSGAADAVAALGASALGGPSVHQSGAAGGAADPGPIACEQCGLTYATFRSRGRLGCPQCYDTFRAQLDPLLERIHAGLQHVGKSPFDGADASAETRARERLVAALRRRLQDAIRAEDYEGAASIRDELTAAEVARDRAGP